MPECLLLSFAVSAISITLTRSALFHDIRQWVLIQSLFFGKLVSCWYCTSHWVAFALAAYLRLRFVAGPAASVDVVVSGFILIGLSAVISQALFKLGLFSEY